MMLPYMTAWKLPLLVELTATRRRTYFILAVNLWCSSQRLWYLLLSYQKLSLVDLLYKELLYQIRKDP